MEQLLRTFLESSDGLVAYASVFGVLVACGLGVPLPEDVSLILGGFLVHRGSAALPVMMAVGFLGILSGDSLIYLAGRRFGSKVGRKPGGFFARIVTAEKRAKVEGMFARHGQKIVMIARFLPGVRAVTYFTAGSAGMSYLRFIFFDGIAALASAPMFVYLGYHFGGELELLVDNVRHGQTRVIGAMVVVALCYLLISRMRKRRAAVVEAAAQAAAKVGPAPVPAHHAPGEPAAPASSARPVDYDTKPPRYQAAEVAARATPVK
ncbi:MAG: DedA family protein [Myxococcaceae bacterium]